MSVDQAKRLKEIEQENSRLKKLVADLSLDNANYPDPYSKKLTHGMYASTAYYVDLAWVGISNPSRKIDIIIDLGKSISVQYFVAEYLLDPQPAVFLPKGVTVFTSVNNITFTEVGLMSLTVTSDAIAAICKYYYNMSAPVNALYVKFSTAFGNIWTFCDEFSVINNDMAGITKNLAEVPNEFALYNAYPNPSNPAINLKFSLAQAGTLSLTIYNVLGELVKTIVNDDINIKVKRHTTF